VSMVLGPQGPGRVDRRRVNIKEQQHLLLFFYVYPAATKQSFVDTIKLRNAFCAAVLIHFRMLLKIGILN